MPKKSDIFIGIDPSLRATGIIVLDENGKIKDQKLLCTKQKDVDRLIFLREKLTEALTTLNKENIIKLVCMESYSFASKGMQFSIGEMGGIYKLVMKDLGLPFTMVAPTVLKKYVTGKGNCKKDLILKEVYKNMGLILMTIIWQMLLG